MGNYFNKKLILLVVLAALVGYAGMVHAGSLGTVAPTPIIFANEIFGTASVVTALPSVGSFQVAYTMDTAPSKNTPFNIDFKLDNGATWGANISAADLLYTAVGAGDVTKSKQSGGVVGGDSVKFRIYVKEDMSPGDTFTLSFTVKSAEALATVGTELGITIDITDHLGVVDTPGNAVYAKSGEGVKLELKADTEHDEFRIDVQTESKLFIDLDPTQPGVADAPTNKKVILGIVNIANGAAMDVDGVTPYLNGGATTGTLTVNGVFNASKSVAGGLYLDLNGNGTYDAGEAFAFNADATKATFNMTNAQLQALADPATVYKIYMVVNGTTAIDEMRPPLGTFSVQNDKLEDVALNVVRKNGSFARKTFLLDPDSKFDTLIRITNPSTISGAVYLTLINDTGDTCMVNLDKVPDIFNTKISGKLAAGASTGLIYVKKLFETAQAQCSAFDVTPKDPVAFPKPGKLRLDVEAEFGETGEYSGVVVDALVPMTDGTGFVMLPSNPY